MGAAATSPGRAPAPHPSRPGARVPRASFFGPASLPTDPVARAQERRGRRWLVASYVLCPCHLPVTLALLGVVVGGTSLGAAVTGNALAVGAVLTLLYGAALVKGFGLIRRAKAIEAAGGAGCPGAACSSRR